MSLNLDLPEVSKMIVDSVQPERILLFGSYARGEERADSDVDLLVIEKESFSNRSHRKELSRIRKALSSLAVAKDILLFDVDEV